MCTVVVVPHTIINMAYVVNRNIWNVSWTTLFDQFDEIFMAISLLWLMQLFDRDRCLPTTHRLLRQFLFTSHDSIHFLTLFCREYSEWYGPNVCVMLDIFMYILLSCCSIVLHVIMEKSSMKAQRIGARQ